MRGLVGEEEWIGTGIRLTIAVFPGPLNVLALTVPSCPSMRMSCPSGRAASCWSSRLSTFLLPGNGLECDANPDPNPDVCPEIAKDEDEDGIEVEAVYPLDEIRRDR